MFESRFQSFAGIGGPGQGKARVAALRQELKRRGLDGFIVPRADRHQNEYVPPSSERLLWLTGFSGSAGLAVVLADRAAIFVDGRYTLQAPEQVDVTVLTPLSLINEPPAGWIKRHLPPGGRLGYDPWLHTPEAAERFGRAAKSAGGELIGLDSNPIDAVWADRPGEPVGAVTRHPPRFCGEPSPAKIARLCEQMNAVDGLVVSDAHNVAWLFNIRGADVAHTPLPLAFAIVPATGRPGLYIEGRKLSPETRDYLSGLAELCEPDRLLADLADLGAQAKRLAFDAATAPARLTEALRAAGGAAEVGDDPITLMKAVKNTTELDGARAAHLRDGAAVTRFLAWFDREAPKGGLTEIAAAQALETFRRETGKLKDISFPTIAGAGPNSAIPHYRVSQASNRQIRRGVFLIDSGGQYRDGTTDITRTVAVGRPTGEMSDRFTRVLKGHIAIARAVFPKGSSGAQIDALARQSLWAAGLDFDHGVGHGVGSYLSVHEGPQRIAKTGATPLVPGMIISNEPGYYAADRFGIRTENLVVVEKREIAGGEREMLGFETISLAPIDTRLIEPGLLDRAEVYWLDAYHRRVRKALAPLVDAPTRAWLRKATRPLAAAGR